MLRPNVSGQSSQPIKLAAVSIRLHLVRDEFLSVWKSRVTCPGARGRQGALQTLELPAGPSKGSHIILQTDNLSRQRIPVPDHATLRIGTRNSILRLVATHKGVDRHDVLATFWNAFLTA
jgi:hypothetical protein